MASVRKIFTVLSLSLMPASLIGCGSGAEKSNTEQLAQSKAAVVVTQNFNQLTLTLPNGLSPENVSAGALNSVRIADRASLLTSDSKPAQVTNSGTGTLEIGAAARVGTSWSVGGIFVRSGGVIDGNATSQAAIERQNGGQILGTEKPFTSVGPLRPWRWVPELPQGNATSASLEPGQSRSLSPGVYADAYIKQGATLTLEPGSYRFAGLSFEPDSRLVLRTSAEPTILYVDGNFTFRGGITLPSDSSGANAPLLVVALGGTVSVERPFTGNIFAPNGRMTLSTGTHRGNFFAADFELQPDGVVQSWPFYWSRLIPSGPYDFRQSPIQIDAWRDLKTGENHTSEATSPTPVDFVIPPRIWVRSGNAGNAQLTLEYRDGTAPVVSCTYQGAASSAHPSTDRERALGLEFRFVSCDNGAAKNQTVRATWVKTTILGGDDQSVFPRVGVQLAFGKGCSEKLEPEFSPYEVTVMREDFHWGESSTLSLTDPNGRPALWHGLIYIDRKEQLAALDRMRIYWSALPIAGKYVEPWKGRCGLVEHPSDGKGVVVYAIFPAKFFNIMRAFGVQAETANIAPPFKFIIPSIPDEPEYVNSDGTLSYEGLAATGYLQWLQSHPRQSPWFGSDLWDAAKSAAGWVSDQASDAWNWLRDNSGVVGDAVLTPFDYATGVWDEMVDWTANALDNVWETIQDGLQEFVLLFSKTVHVKMDIRIMERDAMMKRYSSLFRRQWGPSRTSASGSVDVPAGASIRLRQWGWGFVPVMDETRIADNGHAELEAVQKDSIRAGGTCIELETDYAMMSSDLIPNEVCDFTVGDTGVHFYSDWSGEVAVDLVETYGLTQLHDSYNYARTVMGFDPHPVDVLIGAQANNVTNVVTGKRASTVCLDFPSTGMTMFAAVLPGLGGVGGPLTAVTASIESNILMKDIWWPTGGHDGPYDILDSRGVLTHEYGHFTMCSVAYREGGPEYLRGLLIRLGEQDDNRDAEASLMTETYADTFAMQVAGGANYIHPTGSTERLPSWPQGPNDPVARMGWCTSSPCMDYNYCGNSEYRSDKPFLDELARYQGIAFDAFDRVDSSAWATNAPANGDYWKLYSNDVGPAQSPFIANDDEPVSLPGSALKTWVEYWMRVYGRTPTKQNVLKGLIRTIWDDSPNHSWCDVCEVFAPHYVTTPEPARMANPVGLTRTVPIRVQRWLACMQDGEMSSLMGPAPEKYGNLDGACKRCAPLQHADGNGACAACPEGTVPRGLSCDPCPLGSIAGQDNECHACGESQISVGNTCVTCPDAEGADKVTNTCKPCPIDATVAVPCQELPGCGGYSAIPFNYTGAASDVCPEQFWLEVTGFATCKSDQVYVEIERPDADGANCSNAEGSLAVYGPGVPGTLLGQGAGQFVYRNASCPGDGKFCLPDACASPTVGTIMTAGATTLWIRASATLAGSPVSGQVTIRSPICGGLN